MIPKTKKSKLQIVIFLEFWVVLTVSSFVGNPVLITKSNATWIIQNLKHDFYSRLFRFFLVYYKLISSAVRTRKLWSRKTTLKQCLNVFDVVTQKIVLLCTNLLNRLFRKMSLFTLHNCYVSCSIGLFKVLKLEYKSRPPFPEFSAFHCT